MAVLEVAERDCEQGRGMGAGPFDLDGLLLVYGFACCFFETEIRGIFEVEDGVIGVR